MTSKVFAFVFLLLLALSFWAVCVLITWTQWVGAKADAETILYQRHELIIVEQVTPPQFVDGVRRGWVTPPVVDGVALGWTEPANSEARVAA